MQNITGKYSVQGGIILCITVLRNTKYTYLCLKHYFSLYLPFQRHTLHISYYIHKNVNNVIRNTVIRYNTPPITNIYSTIKEESK